MIIKQNINDLKYELNKKLNRISYPIRNTLYKCKNGFSISDRWECGSAILKIVSNMSLSYNPEAKIVFDSYYNYINSDIYLYCKDNIEREIEFMNISKEIFIKQWDGFGEILLNNDNLNVLKDLELIKKLLIEYRESNIGYPCGYSKEDYFHMHTDIDSFAKSSVSFLYFNDEYIDENGRTKTNEELGLDYTLFNMDIVETYSSLSHYIEWNSLEANGLSLKESFKILNIEECDRITKEINDQFIKSWHWIGSNLRDLWI